MTPPQENRHLRTLTFEAFHDRWFARGVGFAMKACYLSRQDAEEVASDAMVPVHAGWGVIENPAAYYRVVLHRRAMDKLRTVVQRETAETPVPYTDLAGDVPLPHEVRAAFSTLNSPEAIHDQVEQNRRVLDALYQLPLHLRTSLVMAAEGYTAKERAEFKSIKESTERSHLKRARDQFQKSLLAHGLPHHTKTEEPDDHGSGELAEEGEGK
ncbi:RNA polymerase sigma factor [Streptomyces roseoverticillatus]|uniref:RNA polymerase sigma factor n=1 Tax=Streptomyces roseoverticillatus TaxID=66429 RepID=A0ABV3IMG0_9ACTN